MGKVVMYSSVSVDGFIADENDQPGPLFDWLSSGNVPLDESGVLKVSQTSYDYTATGCFTCAIGCAVDRSESAVPGSRTPVSKISITRPRRGLDRAVSAARRGTVDRRARQRHGSPAARRRSPSFSTGRLRSTNNDALDADRWWTSKNAREGAPHVTAVRVVPNRSCRHCQHGPFRSPQHLFGRRAEDRLSESPKAMRAHDDQFIGTVAVDLDERQLLPKSVALAFIGTEVDRLLVDKCVIEAFKFLLDRFRSTLSTRDLVLYSSFAFVPSA
jgi:hypothetical protein